MSFLVSIVIEERKNYGDGGFIEARVRSENIGKMFYVNIVIESECKWCWRKRRVLGTFINFA